MNIFNQVLITYTAGCKRNNNIIIMNSSNNKKRTKKRHFRDYGIFVFITANIWSLSLKISEDIDQNEYKLADQTFNLFVHLTLLGITAIKP